MFNEIAQIDAEKMELSCIQENLDSLKRDIDKDKESLSVKVPLILDEINTPARKDEANKVMKSFVLLMKERFVIDNATTGTKEAVKTTYIQNIKDRYQASEAKPFAEMSPEDKAITLLFALSLGDIDVFGGDSGWTEADKAYVLSVTTDTPNISEDMQKKIWKFLNCR